MKLGYLSLVLVYLFCFSSHSNAESMVRNFHFKYDHTIDDAPLAVRKWANIPFENVDASFLQKINGKEKAYLFSGDEYLRIDLATRKMDEGYPVKVTSGWKGVFPKDIDAAFARREKVYFFKGSFVIRFDTDNDKIDPGYPKLISSLSKTFFKKDIDAIFNFSDNRIYVFKGSQYLRYNPSKSAVDPHYPKAISESTWSGVWPSGIDSAIYQRQIQQATFFKHRNIATACQ